MVTSLQFTVQYTVYSTGVLGINCTVYSLHYSIQLTVYSTGVLCITQFTLLDCSMSPGAVQMAGSDHHHSAVYFYHITAVSFYHPFLSSRLFFAKQMLKREVQKFLSVTSKTEVWQCHDSYTSNSRP